MRLDQGWIPEKAGPRSLEVEHMRELARCWKWGSSCGGDPLLPCTKNVKGGWTLEIKERKTLLEQRQNSMHPRRNGNFLGSW
jgi:hypothetical protein